MSDVIDRHFAAENAHDVEGTLATYTDDVVWDDVTHPLCPVQGKEAAGTIYRSILDSIPDLHLESVRRFGAGEDGGGAPVRVRILHVFELRDGLIARENTWFDAAAVLRQVEQFKRT